MKKLTYVMMLKRKKLVLRFEIATRKFERWLDENLQEAFFGFVMFSLFASQVILYLSKR
jgi:hypothetical protein